MKKILLLTATAMLVLSSTALAADATRYDSGMKPAAIAVDRANRARLLATPRPRDKNAVWCNTMDYRYGTGMGFNYAGSDPDPRIRGALLVSCNNPSDGNSGTTAAAK